MNDINERVQAAFQTEHKEHLEVIRSLLADADKQDASLGETRLEEAFRRAHSLKGGARVCDLRPVEMLGHRLETLFSRVRQGELRLNPELVRVTNVVLDAIEDWMTAKAGDRSPSSPDEAMRAIDRVLGTEVESSPAFADEEGLAKRLQIAFQSEHREYVTGIRALLKGMAHSPEAIASAELDEANRMAHSLNEAARVAEVPKVEQLGRQIESLLHDIRNRNIPLDQAAFQTIDSLLEATEAEMANLASLDSVRSEGSAKDVGESPVADAMGTPTNTDSSTRQSALGMGQVETVRVSTASLDRLLRSAGQLHTESLRQDQVARGLVELDRRIGTMQRERESLRRVSAAALHRLSQVPEFSHVTRYLDAAEEQIRLLATQARVVRTLQRRSSWLLRSLGQQVHQNVRQARMTPAESIFQGFRKMVRDLARDEGKEVKFTVTGFDVLADRMVLQALKDPVMHALRNAVTHGIERPADRIRAGKEQVGQVTLQLESFGNRLRIIVEDDGRGVDVAHIADVAVHRGLLSEKETRERSTEEIARMIFQPGFSTSKVVTEVSGRGMGLSVVFEAVTRLQGEVQLVHKPTPGTSLLISVPLSISTHRLLMVTSGGQTFAIPLHAVERLMRLKVENIQTVEGKPIVSIQKELVPLVSMAHLLEIDDTDFHVEGDYLLVAILRTGTRRLAVGVDAFVAERDCLIHDLEGPAASVPRFAGGILLDDGQVSLVLNPTEVLESYDRAHRTLAFKPITREIQQKRWRVLVVDDSFTTRTLEKNLLEAHGYDVCIAVDGMEALTALEADEAGIDLVISDIQMPRLDGFGLLEAIKKNSRLADTPVILVSSLDVREDKERGLSLGADAYIVKRKFDHEDLLNTINQIL